MIVENLQNEVNLNKNNLLAEKTDSNGSSSTSVIDVTTSKYK